MKRILNFELVEYLFLQTMLKYKIELPLIVKFDFLPSVEIGGTSQDEFRTKTFRYTFAHEVIVCNSNLQISVCGPLG